MGLPADPLRFIAFAGYARIIPRAVVIALGAVVALYATVAVTLLAVLGPQQLAATISPLAVAVSRGAWGSAEPVVRVGAAAASLGALLGLVAGVGRTTLAMARTGDLPP